MLTFQRLLRNILSSWAGYVVTLLVGFFLAPLLVHHLGAGGYGVWTLVVSLTGYCGLLDLGLRSALIRFVSRDIGENDAIKVNTTLSSAMAMLATAGVLAFLATLTMHSLFGLFRLASDIEPAAKAALLICGTSISLILPMTVFRVVLPALERYDVLNAITICGALVRAALIIVIFKLDFGLVALSWVILTVSMAENGAIAVAAKRLYPPLRLSRNAVDRDKCKQLFSFGMYRFIWIVGNQLIFYTDSVVIGLFLNAGAITSYVIAGSLINYGRNIASLATNTLLPVTNRLDTKNDVAGLRKLHVMGTQLGLFVGLVLCTGYVGFGRPFISLWMGEAYIDSATILLVLTLPQFVSMSQYMSSLILVSTGRHRFMAALAIGEAAANLALSIFLVKRMGLIGVAWGTVIPHAITTGVVIPWVTLRALGVHPAEYVRKAFAGPVLCAIPVGLMAYAMGQSDSPSWSWLGVRAAAHVGMFGVLGYFICLDRSHRLILKAALLRPWRRWRPRSQEAAPGAVSPLAVRATPVPDDRRLFGGEGIE